MRCWRRLSMRHAGWLPCAPAKLCMSCLDSQQRSGWQVLSVNMQYCQCHLVHSQDDGLSTLLKTQQYCEIEQTMHGLRARQVWCNAP